MLKSGVMSMNGELHWRQAIVVERPKCSKKEVLTQPMYIKQTIEIMSRQGKNEGRCLEAQSERGEGGAVRRGSNAAE